MTTFEDIKRVNAEDFYRRLPKRKIYGLRRFLVYVGCIGFSALCWGIALHFLLPGPR